MKKIQKCANIIQDYQLKSEENKLKKKIFIISLIIVIIGLVIAFLGNQKEKSKNENLKIVTSFYPIYIMAVNITQNVPNVELANMTEANTGCLHNYTLSTSDMKKIENADIYIQNGLELENFANKIVSTYPNLKVIDSSINIEDKIIYEADGINETEINPHIWTNIQNYIIQVETICQKLCEYDSKNAKLYKENCTNYIQKLNLEKQKYETEFQNLEGKGVLCLNEGLEYLLDEFKMDLSTVETDHEESSLSAETLKDIITYMKDENIKIITIDKDDNTKNAETLANETGAKIYVIDSGLTGELNINAYLDMLEANFLVLKSMIN